MLNLELRGELKFTTKKLTSHGAILQWRPHDCRPIVWVILIQHQHVTDRQTDGRTDLL